MVLIRFFIRGVRGCVWGLGRLETQTGDLGGSFVEAGAWRGA